MIQVYTGNGKGKTTAALGLALRAVGAGKKVFIGQFIKGNDYSELKTLRKIRNIKLEQFGRGSFIKGRPKALDLELADKGMKMIEEIIRKAAYDLVILDEINIALDLKLLKLRRVLNLIKNTPPKIELVLTGRYAPAGLLRRADLVSRIEESKHYFQKGQKARRGIEY